MAGTLQTIDVKLPSPSTIHRCKQPIFHRHEREKEFLGCRCHAEPFLTQMLPGTKHNLDVAIKTVEAAKALSEIGATVYDI